MFRPPVLALHGLGGGAMTFAPLSAQLGDSANILAIDLPGFGSRKHAQGGGDLATMSRFAMDTATPMSRRPWFLLGHSMGGKIAVWLAAALRSAAGVPNPPSGLILMAPSPATPEPMSDRKRQQLLAWSRDGFSRSQAEQFLADDCAAKLNSESQEIALETITNTSPQAWQRWLTGGSRTDITAEVGILSIPTLVLAGNKDAALGATAQPTLQASTLASTQYVTLFNTGHQIPLERPAESATAIRQFISSTIRNSNV